MEIWVNVIQWIWSVIAGIFQMAGNYLSWPFAIMTTCPRAGTGPVLASVDLIHDGKWVDVFKMICNFLLRHVNIYLKSIVFVNFSVTSFSVSHIGVFFYVLCWSNSRWRLEFFFPIFCPRKLEFLFCILFPVWREWVIICILLQQLEIDLFHVNNRWLFGIYSYIFVGVTSSDFWSCQMDYLSNVIMID